jgi:AGCS family alanine or glycine:cation symporter
VFIAGIILFVRYGSFIIFKFRTVISVLFRKNSSEGISPLKTVLLALASTLGVGNIVGVSTAVFAGGPGAVFWMTLSAFAAMPLKYGEVVLAMVTRKKKGGEYRGGAMYYIGGLLKKPFLAALFAILCTVSAITVGNIVQVSAVARSFERSFSFSPLLLGVIGAVLVYLAIRRGTKSVAFITSWLVPLASVIYSALSVYIIVTNIGSLPEIFSLVLENAFDIRAVFGEVAVMGSSGL